MARQTHIHDKFKTQKSEEPCQGYRVLGLGALAFGFTVYGFVFWFRVWGLGRLCMDVGASGFGALYLTWEPE